MKHFVIKLEKTWMDYYVNYQKEETGELWYTKEDVVYQNIFIRFLTYL